MPTPRKNERKEQFISRCMAYRDLQDKPTKQRAGECYGIWDEHKKGKKKLELNYSYQINTKLVHAGDTYEALDGPESDVALDQSKMTAGCVCVTDSLDRVGDIINIRGFQTGNHQKNPLVLFNHHDDDLDDQVGLTQTDTGLYTVQVGEHEVYQTTWFNQSNLLAVQLFDRIMAKQIRANSIGYNIIKSRKNTAGGRFLDEIELIEISWVLVSANADTIRSCLGRDRIEGKPLHPLIKAAYQKRLTLIGTSPGLEVPDFGAVRAHPFVAERRAHHELILVLLLT